MREWKDISYTPVGWRDYPSTSTKMNAENLSKSEKGIEKLIEAIEEIRVVIGDEDNKSKYPTLQMGINELSNKFGGYEGYNLLDDTKLKATNTGCVIEGTIDELKLVPGKDYTLSCESLLEGSSIVLFQYSSGGDVIITEQLTDFDCSKGITFELSKNCNSIKVVFPTGDGYSLEHCLDAKVMLTEGTVRKVYEPYTGGVVMNDIWQEILSATKHIEDNRNVISSHATTLGQHASTLASHGTTIGQHASTISSHGTTLGQHTQLINELTTTMNELVNLLGGEY